jgi:hypothetical protein
MNGALEIPSRLTITRWSLEGLGGTAEMVERNNEGHFVIETLPVNTRTGDVLSSAPPARQYFRAPSSMSLDYPTTAGELSSRWGVLVVFSVVFLIVAGFTLSRNESF